MDEITNAKQRRTLEKINRKALPKNLHLDEVVSLFEHLEYKIFEEGGSSVTFRKKGTPPFTIHKPHPSRHIPPKNAAKIRKYLRETGVIP